MPDINQVITLGIGTPASIPHFILFGLNPAEPPVPSWLTGIITLEPALAAMLSAAPGLSGDIEAAPSLTGTVRMNP